MANNYQKVKKWIVTSDTHKELRDIESRRVTYLEYDNSKKLLTFHQDPVGEGSGIAKDIPTYLKKIFQDNYNIIFSDYFELITLQPIICNLIDNNIFTTGKVRGLNHTTGRVYETVGKGSTDNLKDDSGYDNVRNNCYDIEKMRLRHKDFKNGTFEIYFGSIFKIYARMNGEDTDVITETLRRYRMMIKVLKLIWL